MDIDIVKRFIYGAKEAYKKVDNHSYNFPITIESAYRLATNIETLLKEQEVKTGYWIDSAGNDKCSICGEEYSDLYPDYGNTHFCPNCGAKMEGR